MPWWGEEYYRRFNFPEPKKWDGFVPQTVFPAVIPKVRPRKARQAAPFPRSDAMTATALAIDNFEKTIKQHTAKKVGDLAGILEQIATVKNTNPPVYEEEKIKTFLSQRAKALSCLIDNYLVAKLTTQYPLLDNNIFKLRRHIYVKDGVVVEDTTAPIKGDAIHFEVPLFMRGESRKKVEVGKYKARTRSQWGDTTQRTTVVVATVPETPRAVVEMGRKALAFYYSTLAEILSDPGTSDLLTTEAPPTLETLWIPTAQSLNVKVDEKRIPAPRTYDPALLLNYRDRYYVVGLWDTADELPFENILREFSVGPAKFPKKA